jgi:hypothetical protein
MDRLELEDRIGDYAALAVAEYGMDTMGAALLK